MNDYVVKVGFMGDKQDNVLYYKDIHFLENMKLSFVIGVKKATDFCRQPLYYCCCENHYLGISHSFQPSR